MFTGEIKKNYQRKYMKEYMRKRRGLNKQVLTEAGLNVEVLTRRLAAPQKTKDVFIGGRRFTIPDKQDG